MNTQSETAYALLCQALQVEGERIWQGRLAVRVVFRRGVPRKIDCGCEDDQREYVLTEEAAADWGKETT